MESVKEQARRLIDKMPEDVTWDQVRSRLDLYVQLERGEAEIDAGGGMSNDQVMKEAVEWLASSGRPTLAANSTES